MDGGERERRCCSVACSGSHGLGECIEEREKGGREKEAPVVGEKVGEIERECSYSQAGEVVMGEEVVEGRKS